MAVVKEKRKFNYVVLVLAVTVLVLLGYIFYSG